MSHSFSITGREALFRTVWITGLIAFIYSSIQIALVFGLKIQLFKSQEQSALLYWFISSTVLGSGYLCVLIIQKTRLARYLPVGKGQLYYYVAFLFLLNASRAIGSLVSYFGLYIGFCFIDFTILMYYSFFLPLLYWAFLWEFFRVPTLQIQYSEMVVKGYIDSDT